jgi:hypothetical protein
MAGKASKAIAYSALVSRNGRRDREEKLRGALETAAGLNSAEEMACAVFHTLCGDEREQFQVAFQKLAASKQAVGLALLREAHQHPEQTARSALARAAEAAGQEGHLLRAPGQASQTGIRISPLFWKKAVRKPQTAPI